MIVNDWLHSPMTCELGVNSGVEAYLAINYDHSQSSRLNCCSRWTNNNNNVVHMDPHCPLDWCNDCILFGGTTALNSDP